MAVHGESEAWTEEEAGSPTAWTVPHKETNGEFRFRGRITRHE